MARQLNDLFADRDELAGFIVRYVAKIKKASSGCYEWQGATTTKGYGVIGFGPRSRHVTLYAHRVALWLATGADQPTSLVLHSCDNPKCCNAAHLSYGTAKANSADMVRRDRSTRGERSANAKLRDVMIPAIRRDKRTLKAIGEAYGVDAKQIHRVKRRESWKHVA